MGRPSAGRLFHRWGLPLLFEESCWKTLKVKETVVLAGKVVSLLSPSTYWENIFLPKLLLFAGGIHAYASRLYFAGMALNASSRFKANKVNFP